MKIFVLILSCCFLTACSINDVKPTITNSLKTVITAKKDITTSLIPNGDREIVIDGQSHTIPSQTFDSVKSLIEADSQIQSSLVDLIGSQVTDENIATIAYYVDKYSIPVKDMLNSLLK